MTMPKSRTEIQREYRKRQKLKLGKEEYKQKEGQRTKKYYTPTTDLDKQSRKKRREKIKRQVKRFRQKKNEKMQQARRAENQFIAAERHGLRSTCNEDNPQLPLIVNLNFEKGKKWQRKEPIDKLRNYAENEKLKVQKERYRKRFQRINLQNTSALSCSSVSTYRGK